MVTRDPGTGQQPDLLVKDAQVKPKVPNLAWVSQVSQTRRQQTADHPAKQDAAVGHNQAPPSAGGVSAST